MSAPRPRRATPCARTRRVATLATDATGMTWVTLGAMLANVASYLLHLPAGRWLGPVGYGEFASLLAAQLVLAVPALALQSVIARETARGGGRARLRSLGRHCAAVTAAGAVVAVPLVAWLLDTSLVGAAGALVAAPLLVVLATEQGLLQGSGRFAELGVVLGLAGVGKVTPAVVALALGAGPGIALTAGSIGTAVVAGLAALVVDRRPDDGGPSSVGVASVLRASQVQLALILLTSVDVLLARAVLDDVSAGVYALGAVATKVAFWLPSAVAVVLYPRMADPARSVAAVRSSTAVLVAFGAVAVAGAAVAGPIVPALFGDDYRPVSGLLWAFATAGAALAVLQSSLLAAIAVDRTAVATVVWPGLAVEVALMVTVADDVRSFLAVAAGTSVLVAGVTTALVLRAVSRRADSAI